MKQTELHKLIQNYAATGIIDDALIPYYDQHGRWRGDTIMWKPPIGPSILKMISASILSESRRVIYDKMGPVLRTSFYWTGTNPLTLVYSEIHGSLVVTSNASVHGTNLRRVGGHLMAKTKRRIYLPQLREVGGSFKALKGFLLLAPRLRVVGRNLLIAGYVPPLLESVGGIFSAYWTFGFDSSRLRHVGGSLILHKAETVILAALESIGGGFLLGDHTRSLHAPQLHTIGGDFLATSVTKLRAPRLLCVGGDMDTLSAKGYYHPSIKVGGSWTTYPGAIEDWVARDAARRALKCKPFFL